MKSAPTSVSTEATLAPMAALGSAGAMGTAEGDVAGAMVGGAEADYRPPGVGDAGW